MYYPKSQSFRTFYLLTKRFSGLTSLWTYPNIINKYNIFIESWHNLWKTSNFIFISVKNTDWVVGPSVKKGYKPFVEISALIASGHIE